MKKNQNMKSELAQNLYDEIMWHANVAQLIELRFRSLWILQAFLFSFKGFGHYCIVVFDKS